MKNISIFPGSMEVIGLALDLFGEKRAGIGTWDEPVRVSGLTRDEVAYAEKFFDDIGCEVKEGKERGSCRGSVIISSKASKNYPGRIFC